jgi:hypothetical protein
MHALFFSTFLSHQFSKAALSFSNQNTIRPVKPILRSNLPFISATPGVSSFRSSSPEELLPLDDPMQGMTKIVFKEVLFHEDA